MNLAERITADNHIGEKAERLHEFANVYAQNVYWTELEVSEDDNSSLYVEYGNKELMSTIGVIIHLFIPGAGYTYALQAKEGCEETTIAEFVSGLPRNFTIQQLEAHLQACAQCIQ